MNDMGSVQGYHYCSPSNPYTPDNFVVQPSLSDPAQFVDSEATNHITSNLNNLSLHAPYTGGDKVSIGKVSNCLLLMLVLVIYKPSLNQI